MYLRRLFGPLLAGLTLTLFPLLAPAEEGVTATSIKLGQSAAASGPAAQLGIQMNRGLKLYFDQVNAKGGVFGRKIDLVFLDDGYEPNRAVENTKKLINDEGVFALIGYVGTPTGVVAMPVAIENKVPFFAPFTGAQALREPMNHYVFHLRAGYNEETGEIVKRMTALGLNKIAVFYQNDAYGQAGLSGVVKALAARNLKPVATATVERNSLDVSKAIATLLPAKPDAIVQISAYSSCAAFIKEARKAGYGGQFYNVSFVGTAALAKALGKHGGVGVSQVMPYPYGSPTPIALEFNNALKAAGQSDPDYGAMEGYIAAKVFTEALRRAGRDLTREKLITALESIRDYNVGGFMVDFGPNKHVGSHFVELTMIAEDGRVIR
ncbi:MAG: ABC transporter substrate-binding protein [Betaproteobacteria bacterium]|nr:ABC transporter substrate-binding protein [Betaproteobacteria bacterium]